MREAVSRLGFRTRFFVLTPANTVWLEGLSGRGLRCGVDHNRDSHSPGSRSGSPAYQLRAFSLCEKPPFPISETVMESASLSCCFVRIK